MPLTQIDVTGLETQIDLTGLERPPVSVEADYSALISLLMEDKSHFKNRYVADLAEVRRVVQAIRQRGHKIVLTSGSFDVIHQGHAKYLEAARGQGDFLVVGVDSDSKVRQRKGRSRPAVPELERLEMVAHQRGVGIVTLKHPEQEKWALIKAVSPDVLVVTSEAYSQRDIERLEREHCDRVIVLERMATVSTSARLRSRYLEFAELLQERLPTFLSEIMSEVVGER